MHFPEKVAWLDEATLQASCRRMSAALLVAMVSAAIDPMSEDPDSLMSVGPVDPMWVSRDDPTSAKRVALILGDLEDPMSASLGEPILGDRDVLATTSKTFRAE